MAARGHKYSSGLLDAGEHTPVATIMRLLNQLKTFAELLVLDEEFRNQAM